MYRNAKLLEQLNIKQAYPHAAVTLSIGRLQIAPLPQVRNLVCLASVNSKPIEM